MTAFQSLGISAEDPWSSHRGLGLTGQDGPNFTSHSTLPSTTPGPGKWTRSAKCFTQTRTHKFISTLGLFYHLRSHLVERPYTQYINGHTTFFAYTDITLGFAAVWKFVQRDPSFPQNRSLL